MIEQGIAMSGDPCRECGFDWSTSQADAEQLVAGVPPQFRELLHGSDGSARHPDLSWSAGAYVCHVGDNLRIYAERLAGAARGATGRVTEYDQDDLAAARHYDRIAVESALWAVERSAADWLVAVGMCDAATSITFADGSTGSLRDTVLRTAHDAIHHVWDVERSVGG